MRFLLLTSFFIGTVCASPLGQTDEATALQTPKSKFLIRRQPSQGPDQWYEECMENMASAHDYVQDVGRASPIVLKWETEKKEKKRKN